MMNFAHSDRALCWSWWAKICNGWPFFSAKMTSKMRKEGGGLINQADEEFLFSGRISGGFRSWSGVELAPTCCWKMWGCNMPRQRTISLRRLNARWKWFGEPRDTEIGLQIFGRKYHFWDLTVFFFVLFWLFKQLPGWWMSSISFE